MPACRSPVAAIASTRINGGVVGIQAVSVPVEARDLPHVAAAIVRLTREMPDWTVSDHVASITITGDADRSELRYRWIVAILNERLARDAASRRNEALRELAA